MARRSAVSGGDLQGLCEQARASVNQPKGWFEVF
ncbi:hypothetical protein D1O30_07025 [Methylocystis hirsuta]|uniref:Uncharacterized protein n=1 Tax=Methylocystis hirsuta TaxID=369798 RepID=A0A3M9XV01_9HYPH|nr:hypothetical protein D1O30_07025 [Methylocystis hirsuta]